MRAALTAALLAACVHASAAGGIRTEAYGVTQAGQPVEKVVLENARGMRLAYIDYGATLVAADVADKQGKRTNVILSLPDLAAFERTRGRYGAVIGRYAGRIANARYTLDGKTVQLPANSKGMAIHGDPDPYDKRVWQRQDFADRESIGSIYRLHSADGDQGFAGALDITVTYRLLRKRDEFRIEYQATSSAPTVLNLTNHVYLNLAGAAANTLRDHRFQIAADRYLETDALRIPTGALLDVAGTPFDFRRAASVSARLDSVTGGYDHSLVLAKPVGAYAPVATIIAAGRKLVVSTSEPSVQLYTVNGFDGKEIGSEGVAYQRFGAFAFETQHFPDSPNHASFPSTALRPGQVFRSQTSYRFMTD
ncbi:galactose-1-epimerase [Pseudoduganella sp. FT25W]|uniref:Aldose 1-epimerase n=1 Tax=Duganella alba TaxID=2666081 RepID=A0A6L5QJL8_9BURK|nr:aldose epimerase family protein [Duganella alba]MRX09986.1 galactose-1-epimerase [Duganella alba]MRX17819.1 galactose-1-epimerase [Duganella alba]